MKHEKKSGKYIHKTHPVNCQLSPAGFQIPVICHLSSVIWLLSAVIFLSTCNSGYTPKPTGYFKINFPVKKYQVFSQPGYPYTFEYPVYARVVKDSVFFDSTTENPWWINIEFPQFNSRIY